MSRTLRIFVSSVQREFADERRALRDFIEGDALLRRFFEVFLFEDLPASGRRADEVYLAEVDRCDVYLGLLGNDYGHEDAAGVSPTEREFDRATTAGKERLVFVKGDDDSVRHPKTRALLSKASRQVVWRQFGSIPELTTSVYASLVNHLAVLGAIRTRPFDASACPDATLADISEEKLSDFLGRAQRSRGYALGPDTPTDKALAHLNLLDGGQPTHAAVLLFSREPQRFLITSEVKCLHFHGTEVGKPIPSYQIYRGTVFELVDQAVDFVMSKIARAVGTRAQGPAAPVTYELPHDAVAEAIVNAVAHRDYASNASVQVMLFADRLEVWNPGQLPPPLTPELLRLPHASIPRNPLIAEPLFLTRYVEKAGTGILDMIKLCEAAGVPAPQFRQDGGQFVQTLRRPTGGDGAQFVRPESGLESGLESRLESRLGSATSARVLTALAAGSLSRSAIANAVGHKQISGAINRAIRELLERGLIEPTIPDKPRSRLQEYRLTDQGRAWVGGKET